DWCIVRLGMPGIIRGVVVDTSFFRGNYPDTCALYGAEIEDPLDLRGMPNATWVPLVPRSPLEGNTRNLFPVSVNQRFTHVRLDIHPDGGVARLRVHGEVAPDWSRVKGPIDLAALEYGAVVESCSDMFFGSPRNMLKRAPSRNMGDGWETRRRRGPGHEWVIVRLAATGTIDQLEIDTSHFKGNAPALCKVEGAHAPGVPGDKIEGWRTLIETPLQPHTRHRFDRRLR